MLQHVLLAMAKNLDAPTMHIAEDCCVLWTTYIILLVELRFATRGDDGKVKIPDNQLCFIINFDETCL
jgi:hypothetical protein